MRFENTIEIDAPADRVWALTTDVESWPAITPTMTKVERLDNGPFHATSTARVKQPVTPNGSGASNTLVLDVTGPASGLVGRLVGRQISKALATENAGFKRVAES